MTKYYDIRGVSAFEWPKPRNGSDLAELIVFHENEGSLDDFQCDHEEKHHELDEQIHDAALDLLEKSDWDDFTDYESDGERYYYQLDGSEIGVHWFAGQLVQVGTVAEIAEKWVADFRRYNKESQPGP